MNPIDIQWHFSFWSANTCPELFMGIFEPSYLHIYRLGWEKINEATIK